MIEDSRVVDKSTLRKIQYIIQETKYCWYLEKSNKIKPYKKYLQSKFQEIYSLLEDIRIRDRGEGDVKRRDEMNNYLKEGRSIVGAYINKEGNLDYNCRPPFPVIEGAEYEWIGDGEYFTYIPFKDES